jgi:hypothetical protein
MGDSALGRRQALRGAGVAAGGVAIAGMAATPATARGDHGLLGSWMVDIREDGSSATIRGVASFADGGVVVLHEISPAGPPATGSWSRHGKSFRALAWTGFPGDQGPGSVGPTVRIRIFGTVSGDRISGTFRFKVFAPGSETEVLATGSGTFEGTRIKA